MISVSEVSLSFFFISKFVGELPGEEAFSGGEWYPGACQGLAGEDGIFRPRDQPLLPADVRAGQCVGL